MKSIFDECKELTRKTVKVKIKKALLRIVKISEQQSDFLNKASV